MTMSCMLLCITALLLPGAFCHLGGQQAYMQAAQVPQQQQQQAQMQQHQHFGQPQQGFAPQPGMGQQQGVPQPNLIRDKAHIQDREHIKEHLEGVVNQPDVSQMSEEELQFHYFKLHDNDDNNKLDGCELIKSLIHWHVEESKHLGQNAPPQGTTKIFTDQELSQMIDPILNIDDRNKDGFIDYPEFIAAQKSRSFQ